MHGKCGAVSSSRCFVQFSHPGSEHEPDPGGGKAWNTHDSSHARKFMEFLGRWVDADGSRRSGRLRAWGEWEAESRLVRELRRPDGDWLHPRFLWEPFFVSKSDHRRLHNTDPFIFGERFLYSNCGQPRKPGLRALGRGSVVAFGSGRKIAGERRWMLDTVLVVADSVEYDADTARLALADVVPEAFLEVTAGPIADNEEATFRLYRGATPDDPVDGMYSFFPAREAEGDSGFPRPVIELPDEYFNPRSWQAPKGLWRDRSVDERRGLWRSLAEQVYHDGLVLGIRAALPDRRVGARKQ